MISMVMSVIYIWCQLNKDIVMSFWFQTQFKAVYMPWVILIFQWIVSGSYGNLVSLFFLYEFFNDLI